MQSMRYIIGLSALALRVQASLAAPVYYSDRDTFVQETAPNLQEDFEDTPPVASGVNDPDPATIGNMHFDGYFSVPNAFCQASLVLNDTALLCGAAWQEKSLRIDFLAPVLSWGADFRWIYGGERETHFRFYDEGGSLLAQIVRTGRGGYENLFDGVEFGGASAAYAQFDLVSDTPPHGFTMDSVLMTTARGGPAPVPLPAPVFLLGAGVLGLTALRRKTSA